MSQSFRKSFLRLVCGAVLGLVMPVVSGAWADDGLQVQIDQTIPIRLDRPATTVVVGNPAVADITAQSNNLFFVIGRTMGTTNVVALDTDGAQIANVVVHVTGIKTGQVLLHRSTARESYSCAPGAGCERTQMPGDAEDTYKALVEANTQKLDIAKKGREASSLGN